MEKIYDSSALGIVPMSDGMVIAYCQDKNDDQMTVAFKMVSFETGIITNVTSEFFSIAKYGIKYQSYLLGMENPVTGKIVYLPNGNILIADDKGETRIINEDMSIVWSGTLTHRGNPMTAAAVDGNSLWCSYKDSGIIMRYNLRNMRDELRLGGGRNPVILAPKGIFIEDGCMRVCDTDSCKIFEICLSSYSMSVYREFDEPVHQYIKIRSYEFVLLDSGIYML